MSIASCRAGITIARAMLARLVLLALVLRALIPAGLMPDASRLLEGGFPLVICTQEGERTIQVGHDMRPLADAPDDASDDSPAGGPEPCWFAAAAALFLPILAMAGLLARRRPHPCGRIPGSAWVPVRRAGPVDNQRGPPMALVMAA